MFVWIGNERLYLYSTAQVAAADTFGLIEQIDPDTLAPIRTSPRLSRGGHIWCGALMAHANGNLYLVNGNYAHRLDADLTVLAEQRLPADRPYKGALIMADGALLTKELRLGGAVSSLVSLDPATLAVRTVTPLPEPSMGRLAAARRADGSDWIYAPGDEHVFRYCYDRGAVSRDNTWQPRYRTRDSGGGLACDTCLGDGSVWFFDNGDIPAVRTIHADHPTGTSPPTFHPDAFSTPVNVMRVSVDDDTDRDSLQPSGLPNGWVIAPPVYVPQQRILIGYDTGNRTVTAWRYHGPGDSAQLWTRDIMNWWQPLVYPDTGELLLDDFTDDDDNLVLLDLVTGAEKARVATGSPVPNGMFPCPGRRGDVYYTSNPAIAHAHVATA